MPPAERRQELVDRAAELFYTQGVAATGAAQLAHDLQVSKQTLYQLFGSKDGLLTAVLRAADRATLEHFTRGAEQRATDPADQIVALFTLLAEDLRRPDFRGCRFLNAAAEVPDGDHPARVVVAEHKKALRRWFERTARRADLRRPRVLAAQLAMLFDGASSQAVAVGGIRGRDLVRAAQTLVDAAR